MDFDFSSDQYLLRDSVRTFLSDQWGPRKLRAAAGEPTRELWVGLSGLGLQTLLVPAEYEGVGLDWVDLVLVLEEFGRALVPGPMGETILSADIIARFGSPRQRADLLPKIATGDCRFAFAHAQTGAGHTAPEVELSAQPAEGCWHLQGKKILVPGAQAATHLLVSARGPDGVSALYICETGQPGLLVHAHRAVDASSLLCQVQFNAVSAQPLGADPDRRALGWLLESSTLAAAAQMVGIAAAALDLAVDYARQRTQFDRPIGSFQAIKHKCADMLVALECARSTAYYASWALAQQDAAAVIAVSMAKATCGDACRLVCNDALQIHGGVGFTWDFDIHFYLKRGKLHEYAYGDASYHRERIAQILLDGGIAGQPVEIPAT